MLKAQNRHNVAFPKILDLRISSTCGGWCKAQDSVHCWKPGYRLWAPWGKVEGAGISYWEYRKRSWTPVSL